MKIIRARYRLITFLLMLAFLNLSVGCRNYYKVNTYGTQRAQNATEISRLNDQEKFFIIHFAGEAHLLDNITLNQSSSTLTGVFKRLPEYRQSYKTTDPEGVNRYKTVEKEVLQEVHIYINEYEEVDESMVSIPLSAIKKIEVYDKAQGATIASWVFGIGSVVLSASVLLIIIVLLTKESCPFIYEYNGEHYVFTGEIFSGAIRPWLERDDYLLLPEIKPYNEHYQLKVTNEIKEIQHINLMELMVIDHPEDVQVMVDKYGNIQTIGNVVNPGLAETFSGLDVLDRINRKDATAYYCDEALSTQNTLDGIILEFDKPQTHSEAKLILRAKNSFWIEHVMSNFHGLFGKRYDSFTKKQENNPPAQPHEWMLNQSIPIKVYLWKNNEWVFTDFFNIAGPMAFRDDILSIPVADVPGESLRIKLETGLLFWEIDYVAMDYSENIPLNVHRVAAAEAIDEQDVDVLAAIAGDDHLYYVQPDIGNESIVKYPVPPFSDQSRTILLHSKGHYKILREGQGRPNLKVLKTFRDPGRLPLFSKQLYEQILSTAEN